MPEMRKLVSLILICTGWLAGTASVCLGNNGTPTLDSLRVEIHNSIALADSLMGEQLIDSAIVVGDQARAEALQRFGETDTTVARLDHRLGLYNFFLAKYDEAESHWKEALKIRERIFGENHPDVALMLNNLANIYMNEEQFEESEICFKRAINIWNTLYGQKHPDYAMGIDGLATLYWNAGRYNEAESLFMRALSIRENTLGPTDPDLAATLNNLALLYDEQGKYDKTEAMYLRALRIYEVSLGPEHPNVATTLNNLANLYFFRGMYSKVEEIHKRALEIRRKAFGEYHPDVAHSLNNLAVLYWSQGRLDEAKPLYVAALDIWNKIGSDNVDAARSMNNLGDIFRSEGRYGDADSLLNRALTIRESILGNDHPDVALSLDKLADLRFDLGDYNGAREYLEKSISIKKNVYGENHPETADSMSKLAGINSAMGEYQAAIDLLENSLRIREAVFSDEHPDVIENLLGLAKLSVAIGNIDAGAEYYSKWLRSRKRFIENVFGYASESQKLGYIREYPLIDGAYLTFVRENPTYRNKLSALEMVFLGKAAVLNAVSEERRVLFCSADSEMNELAQAHFKVLGEIANLSLAGAELRDEDLYHDRLSELYMIKDSLETRLSSMCADFKASDNEIKFDIGSLSKVVPPSTAAWEFIRYRPYSFDRTGKEAAKYDDPRYLVFAVDSRGEVSMVDLGEASRIDSLIKSARKMVYDAGTDVFTVGDSSATAKLQENTGSLYELIFAPLEFTLSDSNRILISPDGALNLIPFEILTDSSGMYMIEKYSISYLSSLRDLFNSQKSVASRGPAVMMADPDFDLMAMPSKKKSIDRFDAFSYSTEPVRAAEDCYSGRLDPLPGTRSEAEEVGRILRDSGKMPVYEYYGKDADETIIKNLEATPRILHLSSHGIFCDDDGQFFSNPLLKSGIALAGANRHEKNDEKSESRPDDGILTAFEVSGMDLSGTELVTLSACESGVGEIMAGEGIYGLRRAFQHAGAEAIIMSLWKVPDQETAQLMSAFYSNWLKGMTKPNALRSAALSILNDRRTKYGVAHPYFWGAFILQIN